MVNGVNVIVVSEPNVKVNVIVVSKPDVTSSRKQLINV